MATSTIKSMCEIEQCTLATYSFGTLSYIVNKRLKIATVAWQGNGTAGDGQAHSVSLPSGLIPYGSPLVPLYIGGFLQVNPDGIGQVRVPDATWSAGSVTYITR
jgi:hypothetical protein